MKWEENHILENGFRNKHFHISGLGKGKNFQNNNIQNRMCLVQGKNPAVNHTQIFRSVWSGNDLIKTIFFPKQKSLHSLFLLALYSMFPDRKMHSLSREQDQSLLLAFWNLSWATVGWRCYPMDELQPAVKPCRQETVLTLQRPLFQQ